MLEHPQHAKIVRSLIDLAHNLDLQVVAEGVENEPILEGATNSSGATPRRDTTWASRRARTSWSRASRTGLKALSVLRRLSIAPAKQHAQLPENRPRARYPARSPHAGREAGYGQLQIDHRE